MVWRSERKAAALYSPECRTPTASHTSSWRLSITDLPGGLWRDFRTTFVTNEDPLHQGTPQLPWPQRRRGDVDQSAVGRACWMSSDAQPKDKMALLWTADGTCRQDCPMETWKCTTGEKEMKECSLTWETITRQAADQQQWCYLVDALCPT